LNQFTFSGAHNSLIFIKNGELNSVSADKQPIGAYDHKKPFTQKVLNGSDIDSLYLFSDGYPDQFGGPKNKKFSKKRFKQLLLDIEKQPMVEQREILLKNFSSWRGDLEQIDDVTIVGFKVNQK
jgi:serine phosphatase RsbU (regulator of sigma subunit)